VALEEKTSRLLIITVLLVFCAAVVLEGVPSVHV